MSETNVGVGVGVFVFKDGKFLMQRRMGSHGEGTWAPPGGHIEFGESFEDTARREVKEETDLEITNVRFGAVTNDHFESENKHYVTIWMLSDWKSGQERITEPHKCTAQAWHTFDDLPAPLFLTLENLFKTEFFEDIRQQL